MLNLKNDTGLTYSYAPQREGGMNMKRAKRILRTSTEWSKPVRHVTGDCMLWPTAMRQGQQVYELEEWENYGRERRLPRDF